MLPPKEIAISEESADLQIGEGEASSGELADESAVQIDD